MLKAPPSRYRAFLLPLGGPSSWRGATSKSMSDAVRPPGRVSPRRGENPAMGVRLAAGEKGAAAAQERPGERV